MSYPMFDRSRLKLKPLAERLHDMTRHILGCFAGQPGARQWRRHLSTEAPKRGAGIEVLREALGVTAAPDIREARTWGGLKPGSPLGEPGTLFPRIQPLDENAADPSKVRTPPAPAPAAKKAPAPGPAEQIAYEDFAKLDLRTATVIAAERVEGADKLLKLQVRIGEETRPIVAGIAKHYTPETLVGRTVIVVANLAPAKIRGVESRGMLLAASAGETMRLVTVDGEIPSGARAK